MGVCGMLRHGIGVVPCCHPINDLTPPRKQAPEDSGTAHKPGAKAGKKAGKGKVAKKKKGEKEEKPKVCWRVLCGVGWGGMELF